MPAHPGTPTSTKTPRRGALWLWWCRHLFWRGIESAHALYDCIRGLGRDDKNPLPLGPRLRIETLEERNSPDDIGSLLGLAGLASLVNLLPASDPFGVIPVQANEISATPSALLATAPLLRGTDLHDDPVSPQDGASSGEAGVERLRAVASSVPGGLTAILDDVLAASASIEAGGRIPLVGGNPVSGGGSGSSGGDGSSVGGGSTFSGLSPSGLSGHGLGSFGGSNSSVNDDLFNSAFSGSSTTSSTGPVFRADTTEPTDEGVPRQPTADDATDTGTPAITYGDPRTAPNREEDASALATLTPDFGKLSTRFEANRGQTDSSVKFLARSPGQTLFLTNTQAVLSLAGARRETETNPERLAGEPHPEQETLNDVLRMSFVGANPDAAVVGEDELLTKSNYFKGSDPSRWQTDVSNYSQVRYKGVYDGIDLVWHPSEQSGRQFQFDWLVSPGADTDVIRMDLAEARNLRVDEEGNLVVGLIQGDVKFLTPVVYQQDGAERKAVQGSYRLLGDNRVGFQLSDYDRTRELVIDPTISWSTYLGGSGFDSFTDVGSDASGGVYVVGNTNSTNMPTVGSFQTAQGSADVYAAKFSADGQTLLYATYLGGSSYEYCNALTVDAAGQAILVGRTASSNFPTGVGGYQTARAGYEDAFILKLSATGNAVVAGTFLGGSGSSAAADDLGIDSAGFVYVGGTVYGSTFPTTAGMIQTTASGGNPDLFLAKLPGNLSTLVYSTYLGGQYRDEAAVLAVAADGSVVFGGRTESDDLPFTPTLGTAPVGGSSPAEGFLVRINPGATTIVWGAYLGGNNAVYVKEVALDRAENVYVAGSTNATDFPVANAYQSTNAGSADAYLSKLNASGTTLVYSTYLGGTSADEIKALAVTAEGRVWVTGETDSTDFPTVDPVGTYSLWSTNAFVAEFTEPGGLSFSTLLGGSSSNGGLGIAVDRDSNPVVVGSTFSTNFPTQTPLYGTSSGFMDGFVTKIFAAPRAAIVTITTDSGLSDSDRVTNDTSLVLSGTATPLATVTLSREDLGSTILGTTTASSGGTWSYDYTGTTLAERTYNFKVRATAGGKTSLPSDPFLVTIDTTSPTVTLTTDANTTSFAPEIQVVATDANGMAATTTVTLDVDLDNDGDFLDYGEADYQTAALVTGLAIFHLDSAFNSTGTRKFQARVQDIAGNEGTSATQTVNINATSSPWTPSLTTSATGNDIRQSDPTLVDGSLTTSHALDLDQSPGGSGFALVYASQSADAKPVVTLQVTADNSQALPATLTVTLTWDTGGTPVVSDYVFDTSNAAPGDTLTFALQGPAVTTTGRYRWTIDGSADYGTPVTFTLDGTSFILPREGDIFGTGWSLAGFDRLLNIAADGALPAGKLWVSSTGDAAFFASDGMGGFISPTGDAGTLAASGGGFLYTSPTNAQVQFDSAGKQTALISPDGLSTTAFTYSGSDLVGIQTPDGALTTLTLNSGKVETIATGSRVVTLAYDTDDLTLVTSPDGGLHTFSYDANHKLTGEEFGLTRGTYAYDAEGLLTGWTQGEGSDAIRTSITPLARRGLGTLHTGTQTATLTDPAGGVWRSTLDAEGRLLRSLAPNGALTVYGRDGNGWVTSVTDPVGRTTTFTLDGKGFTTQVQNPDASLATFTYASNAYHSLLTSRDENNNLTTYAYDAYGHQTGMTDALGQRTTNTFDGGTGRLLTTTDARNHTTEYAHDGARRLETIQYADGGVAEFTYDAEGNVATSTNQRGYTTTFTNDVMGRVLVQQTPDGALTTATYDATGLVLTTRTPGNVTFQYDYDTRGLAEKATEGVGTSLQRSTLQQYNFGARTSASRDAAGNWTTQFGDVVGRTIATADAAGGTTANVYDLAGQLLWYRNELGQTVYQGYDNRGRVTSTIDTLGNLSLSTYDAVGNRTMYSDANGTFTTTTYDALNRSYQVQTAASTFTTTTFDEVGNMRTVKDAGGKVVTYTYDEVNRQVSVTNAENETTTYGYDLAGNRTTVTNARNKTTTYVYDSMNRVVETINPDNERTTTVYDISGVVSKTINALNQTVTYLYDALLQGVGVIDGLGREGEQILDALGRAVVNIDPDGKLTQSLFDGLGQFIGGIDGLGNRTRTDHDAAGRVIRSVDGNGNATEQVYDDGGRLVLEIDALGYGTARTYDANGNLRTYKDASNNVTTFSYDSLNREIEREDALGNSLTYAYDTRNRMTSQTDRLGRRKDFTYDDAGRVLTETWVNNGGGTANVLTYTYDDNGNVLSAADFDGSYVLAYDNQDRLESQTGLYGVSLTFAYDALGRRERIDDSFGGVLSSVYDAGSQLIERQFSNGAATLTYERDYTDSGQVLEARRYSDLTSSTLVGSTTFGYDAAYNVTSIQHKDGGGSNLAAYTYTYDAGHRITEEKRNGTSVTYSYDTTSQLTQAGAATYSYDETGNRTMSGYVTDPMNQLKNDGTFTYTYDLEGNVNTKSKGSGLETWFYGYDHNNRLLSVRKTSDGTTNMLTVTYAYDVFANRIKEDKWSSGPGLVTTKFVYVGQEVYLDLDNSDAVLMRYIQGDQADEMIARIDGSNVVDWYLTDRLGSVRDIVDYTGALADSVTYDAYGKVVTESTPGYMQRYGAFGMVWDTDLQRLDSQTRGLDVLTGRWDRPDDIWFEAGDPNLYRYVGNNPTNATDPTGRELFVLGKQAAREVEKWLADDNLQGEVKRLADQGGRWEDVYPTGNTASVYYVSLSKQSIARATALRDQRPAGSWKYRYYDSMTNYGRSEVYYHYSGAQNDPNIKALDTSVLSAAQVHEVWALLQKGGYDVAKSYTAGLDPYKFGPPAQLSGKWQVSICTNVPYWGNSLLPETGHVWIEYYNPVTGQRYSADRMHVPGKPGFLWNDSVDTGRVSHATRTATVTDPRINSNGGGAITFFDYVALSSCVVYSASLWYEYTGENIIRWGTSGLWGSSMFISPWTVLSGIRKMAVFGQW